jgi:hypothetical protein
MVSAAATGAGQTPGSSCRLQRVRLSLGKAHHFWWELSIFGHLYAERLIAWPRCYLQGDAAHLLQQYLTYRWVPLLPESLQNQVKHLFQVIRMPSPAKGGAQHNPSEPHLVQHGQLAGGGISCGLDVHVDDTLGALQRRQLMEVRCEQRRGAHLLCAILRISHWYLIVGIETGQLQLAHRVLLTTRTFGAKS